MTRETTMICDACSRVIDGVNSALAETLRGPSGDDAVDLCDWCVDAVREFLNQKRDAVPARVFVGSKDSRMKEPDLEQASRIMNLERTADGLRLRNLRLECDVARLEGVIEGMEKGKEMMGKSGKPDDETVMEEPNIHRHAATMLGAENDALWSHVRKCRKSRAVKEALDRRNAEVAALLPAGSVVVSVVHPVLPATVYLVFSSDSIPDVVVVYGDEKLTVAAVADLIRTRAKP